MAYEKKFMVGNMELVLTPSAFHVFYERHGRSHVYLREMDEEWANVVINLLERFVAAEREACAQVAEADASVAGSQNFHADAVVGKTIAAAIRARGETPLPAPAWTKMPPTEPGWYWICLLYPIKRRDFIHLNADGTIYFDGAETNPIILSEDNSSFLWGPRLMPPPLPEGEKTA